MYYRGIQSLLCSQKADVKCSYQSFLVYNICYSFEFYPRYQTIYFFYIDYMLVPSK